MRALTTKYPADDSTTEAARGAGFASGKLLQDGNASTNQQAGRQIGRSMGREIAEASYSSVTRLVWVTPETMRSGMVLLTVSFSFSGLVSAITTRLEWGARKM